MSASMRRLMTIWRSPCQALSQHAIPWPFEAIASFPTAPGRDRALALIFSHPSPLSLPQPTGQERVFFPTNMGLFPLFQRTYGEHLDLVTKPKSQMWAPLIGDKSQCIDGTLHLPPTSLPTRHRCSPRVAWVWFGDLLSLPVSPNPLISLAGDVRGQLASGS